MRQPSSVLPPKLSSTTDGERIDALVEANQQLELSLVHAQASIETISAALSDSIHAGTMDPLTGLANRTLLLERIGSAIASSLRSSEPFAVLILDIDRFRAINVSLGNEVGDRILQYVAGLLIDALQADDTVARYGGDEFVVILPHADSQVEAQQVALQIQLALAQPLPAGLTGRIDTGLAASVGVAMYPDDGYDAETLIRHADAQMYLAKHVAYGRPGRKETSQSGRDALGPVAPLSGDHGDRAAALSKAVALNLLLREANQQLVLAALTAQELRAAADEARERQAYFLAMLAHELRAPLAPIATANELLERSDEASVVPFVKAVIERQLKHVTQLVDDLSDMTRLQSGKLRLSLLPVNLLEVLSSVVQTCEPGIQARGQALVLALPPQPVMVAGDVQRLTQIFINLLVNASKYTPIGGSITLSVDSDSCNAKVSVSDTGIGISAAALPYILDPFVQEAHAIGYDGSGLGIGLTVVRELVHAHQGQIDISSGGLGCGSTFLVTLPLEPGSQAAPVASGEVPGIGGAEQADPQAGR